MKTSSKEAVLTDSSGRPSKLVPSVSEELVHSSPSLLEEDVGANKHPVSSFKAFNDFDGSRSVGETTVASGVPRKKDCATNSQQFGNANSSNVFQEAVHNGMGANCSDAEPNLVDQTDYATEEFEKEHLEVELLKVIEATTLLEGLVLTPVTNAPAFPSASSHPDGNTNAEEMWSALETIQGSPDTVSTRDTVLQGIHQLN